MKASPKTPELGQQSPKTPEKAAPKSPPKSSAPSTDDEAWGKWKAAAPLPPFGSYAADSFASTCKDFPSRRYHPGSGSAERVPGLITFGRNGVSIWAMEPKYGTL